MEQFVLSVVQIAQRDVLRYAVEEPGVLSVMITGTLLMLQLSVDSLDMNQVSCSIPWRYYLLRNSKCPGECLLWTREWNNSHG